MDKNEAMRHVVDADTGEAYEMTLVSTVPKRGRKPTPNIGFTQLWVEELLNRTAYVSTPSILLFIALASWMDPKTGEVRYQLGPLRDMLGYAHDTAVSRLISELVEADMVRKLGRGRLVINQALAWRGSAGDRTIAEFRWHNAANGSQQAGE